LGQFCYTVKAAETPINSGNQNGSIVPFQVRMKVQDKETGEISFREPLLGKDEGNRADTASQLKPVHEGGVITGGNASQLSDGVSAFVLTKARLAEQRGLELCSDHGSSPPSIH